MGILEIIREQKVTELNNIKANAQAVINELQLPVTLEQVPKILQIKSEIEQLTAQIGDTYEVEQ